MSNVLISYYIEVVNVLMISCTLPYIYVLCLMPLPLPLAQLSYIISHCCAALIVALGSAVSCFHIIYVTKFEILFSLDPQEVGRRVFFILAIFICLPNAVVGIQCTFHGLHAANDVVMLTQTEYNGPEIQFIPIYSSCWAFLFFILSCVAFVFLPIFFKKQQTNSSEVIQPQRTISLQRYLLGSLGFFCFSMTSIVSIEQNDNRRLPITARIIFLFVDLLLAYHLTEREARKAAQRYLFNLFHINDSVTSISSAGHHIQGTERFQQSPAAPVSMPTRNFQNKTTPADIYPLQITDVEIV